MIRSSEKEQTNSKNSMEIELDDKSVRSGVSDITVASEVDHLNDVDKSNCRFPLIYAGKRPTLNKMSQTKADLLTLSRDTSSWKRLPLNRTANVIDRCVSSFLLFHLQK